MTKQYDQDHAAPYRDKVCEGSGERIQRVASIGRANLLAWYARTKNNTYPDTYGQSGCEFAFSVAYEMVHGDRRTIDKLNGYDYDVKRAIEIINQHEETVS